MKIRSSEQWQRIESIFSGAIELPAEARRPYLDQCCANDPELRSEVERMLAASERAGDFLEVLDADQATKLLHESSEVGASIGRYKVIRKIGAGGMGIVYLAEDTKLQRSVAVKLLPPWLDASSTANKRLLDEARAASAIDHPNIATVHEIGETDDGRLFITMSYYDGDTLRERMTRETMTVDTALDIAIQTANGLGAAHRKGIIHRDIKPENLLLTGDGRIKIVDFGLARAAEHTLSQQETVSGTVAYMSPEQTLGAGLDARTDLWSLGIVLYEMLAGERPFKGARNEIISSIRNDSAAMNGITSDVPTAVRAIVERCLQRDRGARYKSADEMVSELKAVRRSFRSANQTTRDRKRTLVLSAAAITILAVVGVAGAWRERTTGDGKSSVASLPAERGSLAVLPFVDMSPASDHEYLSDGIAEELITALASVDRLRVVARSSAFQFKGKTVDVRTAGATLGVAHVLEGSVRSSGEQLRITVRLADAKKGYEVWSQVFDRNASDVFAVQSEIARAVVRALKIELDPRERVQFVRGSNADAYELYLKGRHLFNQRTNLHQAVRYFRESVAKDSTFAPAWAGLGKTWLVMPVYTAVPPAEAADSAELALGKALSIDSLFAEAHAAIGSLRADEWRWNESEPHFKRAIQLSSTDPTTYQWYGSMLVNVGRIDEGIAQLKIAHKLDPSTSVIPSDMGWAHHCAGRDEDALAAFRTAIDFNPDFGYAHLGMGSALIGLGRISEAVREFEKGVELLKGTRGSRAYLARGYVLAGRRAEAEKIFADLKRSAAERNGSAWGVASVAVALGLNEEAMRWLQVAYDRGETSMGHLKVNPEFKELRSDPRFVALVKKMGL